MNKEAKVESKELEERSSSINWRGITLRELHTAKDEAGRQRRIAYFNDIIKVKKQNPLEWDWGEVDMLYNIWMALPYEVRANLDIDNGKVKILKTAKGSDDPNVRTLGRRYVDPIDEMAICVMHTHPRGVAFWFSAPDLAIIARSIKYPSYVGAWSILVSKHGYIVAKPGPKMIKASVDIPKYEDLVKYYEKFVPLTNKAKGLTRGDYTKEEITAVYEMYTSIGMIWYLVPSTYYKIQMGTIKNNINQ